MVEVHPIPTGTRFRDLAGQIFGRLTVESYAGRMIRPNRGYDQAWNCVCTCGNRVVMRGWQLTGKKPSQSCGCIRREKLIEMTTIHGHYAGGDNPEFSIYRLMIERCCNENDPAYHNYGGRGITVCERWLGPDGFANFLADLGPRPDVKLTLDRKDNERGYEPDNCRWATRTEQNRNRRDNALITFRGETLCLAAWAERLGLRTEALWLRLHVQKRSLEDALTTPKAKRYR